MSIFSIWVCNYVYSLMLKNYNDKSQHGTSKDELHSLHVYDFKIKQLHRDEAFGIQNMGILKEHY